MVTARTAAMAFNRLVDRTIDAANPRTAVVEELRAALPSIEHVVLVRNLMALPAANEAELLYPIDLGSKGSATLGGTISTNAGGNRVLRWGMTRANLLGIEVVLAHPQALAQCQGWLSQHLPQAERRAVSSNADVPSFVPTPYSW